MLFYRTVRELEELLAGTTAADHPLDRAALQLASIESGGDGVATDETLAILDGYADDLRERLDGRTDSPAAFVHCANDLLFRDLGYRGNDLDYYNARNSCLDHVVASRRGIPITLAVMYLEVARRLGQPVVGIGLPGHFMVQFDDGQFSTYIDVFDGGRLMNRRECIDLVRERVGVELAPDSPAFRPAGKREILMRMLANLRAIYVNAREWTKAHEVLRLLLIARPESAEEYRQRGLIGVQLSRLRAAAADLEKYLVYAPAAPDRDEVRRQIQAIRQRLASMN
jgi:regulator of sirC expression with transglutaminase-like and TPR domain